MSIPLWVFVTFSVEGLSLVENCQVALWGTSHQTGKRLKLSSQKYLKGRVYVSGPKRDMIPYGHFSKPPPPPYKRPSVVLKRPSDATEASRSVTSSSDDRGTIVTKKWALSGPKVVAVMFSLGCGKIKDLDGWSFTWMAPMNERKWMGKNPTTYRSYRKFHPGTQKDCRGTPCINKTHVLPPWN